MYESGDGDAVSSGFAGRCDSAAAPTCELGTAALAGVEEVAGRRSTVRFGSLRELAGCVASQVEETALRSGLADPNGESDSVTLTPTGVVAKPSPSEKAGGDADVMTTDYVGMYASDSSQTQWHDDRNTKWDGGTNVSHRRAATDFTAKRRRGVYAARLVNT